MTAQLMLFADQDVQEEDEDEPYRLKPSKRCGTCASMDTSLPGCTPGEIGRCVDPTARSYYLKPENTCPNDWLSDGDPQKYPPGGSWAYVARESCACEQHRPKGRAL